MASAKCCAPRCEMLFSERFNVRSWQLLLMALAKCCAPMSEMLFSERSNVRSWQLLLLKASAKYFAVSSVNWLCLRFNQLSWDSLHFNNLQISKQPNGPTLLWLKSKCEICWTFLITFTNEEQSTAVRWPRIKFTKLKLICWSFLWTIDSILSLSLQHLKNVTAKSRSSSVGQQVTILSSFSVHSSL